MLVNYLKISWRHLRKNKTHTVINVLGLSTGMAVALLVGIWVWDELSFNHYHRNHDRIAEILSIGHFNGAVEAGAYSSVPVAAEDQGEAVAYGPDGRSYFTAGEKLFSPQVLSETRCR